MYKYQLRNAPRFILPALLCASLCIGCSPDAARREGAPSETAHEEEPVKRIDITYHLLPMKDSGMAKLRKYSVAEQNTILAINRVDRDHVAALDTLVLPDTFIKQFSQYSPYPFKLPFLKDVNKLVFFSYPAQAFAAYEHGTLVKWGPTSMGRQKDPTPTGLFYANWKAEETQSTVDDEWILRWNFNIQNKEGIGWHQYAMPGYPASHSCLRMMESDARFMYEWADQWILENDEKVKANGTPVIVFGSYPFGGEKPWYALARNGKAMDISEDALEELVKPHKQELLDAQQKLAQAKGSAK